MSKYSFDLFTEQIDILEEMGRPNPMVKLGDHGEVANQLFAEVGKVMRTGGKLSDGTRVPGMGGNREKNRQLRYFLYTLLKMDEDDDGDEVSDIESRESIIAAASDLLGIDKSEYREHFSDVDKLYRAAILAAVEKYKDYVTSEEFANKVTDKDNILSFVSSNRFTTAYSHAKADTRSELYGMDATELDDVQSGRGIYDKIKEVIRAQAVRKSNITKGRPSKHDALTSNDNSSSYIDNLIMVLDALELLLMDSKSITDKVNEVMSRFKVQNETTMEAAFDEVQEIYPTMDLEKIKVLYYGGVPLYQKLYQAYSTLKDTGLDLEDFYRRMETFKSQNSNSPTIPRLVDLLIKEVKEFENYESKIDDEVEDELSGYDRDILNKYLQTPEEKKIFQDFAKVQQRKREITQQNAASNALSKEVSDAVDDYANQKVRELQATNERLQSALQKQDQTQVAQTQQESYVMNYMVEQVEKDRFQPRGEFKDRGFKKLTPHEWLVKNLRG